MLLFPLLFFLSLSLHSHLFVCCFRFASVWLLCSSLWFLFLPNCIRSLLFGYVMHLSEIDYAESCSSIQWTNQSFHVFPLSLVFFFFSGSADDLICYCFNDLHRCIEKKVIVNYSNWFELSTGSVFWVYFCCCSWIQLLSGNITNCNWLCVAFYNCNV